MGRVQSDRKSLNGTGRSSRPEFRAADVNEVVKSIIEDRKRQALNEAGESKVNQPGNKEAKPHFPGYPHIPYLGYSESYAGRIKVPKVEYPPRQKWIKPPNPIHRRDDVPQGWNDREPDLDPE